jgi:hypothetical protein
MTPAQDNKELLQALLMGSLKCLIQMMVVQKKASLSVTVELIQCAS